MTRDFVVCDTETSGLDLKQHQAVEVAWWNLSTDERGVFVPNHNIRMVLHDADLAALRINRYIDLIAPRMLEVDATNDATRLLANQLNGATLVGSNPAFDAVMLTKLFGWWNEGRQPLWHHRLWDVSAYAAGVLNLEELPGLAKLCELLDIPPGDHTAQNDVTACGLCFRALRTLAMANEMFLRDVA